MNVRNPDSLSASSGIAGAGYSGSGVLAYAKTELSEFLRFLQRPRRRKYQASGRRDATRRIALFFVFVLIFDLLVALPLDLALDSMGGFRSIERSSVVDAVFAVLLAPILEELVFRAGLRNAPYTLFVGPVLIAAFSASSVVFLALAGVMLMAGIVSRFLDRRRVRLHGRKPVFARGRQFARLYPAIFWTYAAAFALVHVSNYQIHAALGALVVFAVSAQFFGGLCLGYLRLRDGLSSAMMLHFLNNAVAVTLACLFD